MRIPSGSTKVTFQVMHPPSQDDPVLRNSRREAWVILLIWCFATFACCGISGYLGFQPASKDGSIPPIPMIGGIPSWFVWGVFLPWGCCFVLTWWFAGLFMTEDDLGSDHAGELESDIREEATHG